MAVSALEPLALAETTQETFGFVTEKNYAEQAAVLCDLNA